MCAPFSLEGHMRQQIIRAAARISMAHRHSMFFAFCAAAGISGGEVAFRPAESEERERYRGARKLMRQAHGMDASLG